MPTGPDDVRLEAGRDGPRGHPPLVALILATFLDVSALLAVLLVAVSGFIFGRGPEGANGETTAVPFWCCAFPKLFRGRVLPPVVPPW